jgi:hypothetical protein
VAIYGVALARGERRSPTEALVGEMERRDPAHPAISTPTVRGSGSELDIEVDAHFGHAAITCFERPDFAIAKTAETHLADRARLTWRPSG